MSASGELVALLEEVADKAPAEWRYLAKSHVRRLKRIGGRGREDALHRLEGFEELAQALDLLDTDTQRRLVDLSIEAWSDHWRGCWLADDSQDPGMAYQNHRNIQSKSP